MSSSLHNGIEPPLTSGEDTASPFISAQIELRRNGDFVTRSNNVECVYRRVNPDDWDDDGLPNEDDPEPHYRAEGVASMGYDPMDRKLLITSRRF